MTAPGGQPRRVAVAGAAGQMGATVCAAVLAQPDLQLVAAVDPAFAGSGEAAEGEVRLAAATAVLPMQVPRYAALETALSAVEVDVLVDFTRVEAVRRNLETCLAGGVAAVVGTTGLSDEDMRRFTKEAAAARVPILIAPNFALGAVLMMQFAQEAARHLEACEIIELHHDRKLDAPSGTAKRTGDLIGRVWRERGVDRDPPIHSVRLPGLVAHQEVIFGGLGQTLTIRHDSISRESFMPGVILAVRRIDGIEGLVVGLENIL